MQKQYDLLRLIVQKMEIVTEDDNKDEGLHTVTSLEKINQTASFSHPHMIRNVARTHGIVSHWKRSVKETAEDKGKFDKA